jgi:hypothetical protein
MRRFRRQQIRFQPLPAPAMPALRQPPPPPMPPMMLCFIDVFFFRADLLAYTDYIAITLLI